MIKILHWLNDFSYAGTPRNAEVNANYLSERGYKNIIATYRDADHDRKSNLYARVDFETISRENRRDHFNQLIKEYQPDIIHSYRSGASEFPEPSIDFPIGNMKFVETNVFACYDANPNITKTLYMSEYLWKYVARTNGPRFDFVNIPIEKPITDEVDIINKDGKIVLIRFGRADNGIYDPINVQAVHLLLEKRKDLRGKLIFYLLSPPSNMLIDLEKYNIPYLTKSRTCDWREVNKYINTADIIAAARADGESFSACNAEAMICGKPIVTHVARGNGFQNQCFMIENNKTGFVVPYSVEEYANALERLIDDPHLRRKMGLAGQEKAMREFEASVCVDKLEGIYKEILESR